MGTPTPPPTGPPRGGGLPRWAWVLIVVLIVVTVVSAATAIFAGRGREVVVLPGPTVTPTASGAAGTSTGSPSGSPPATVPTVADGCLGGPTDLDHAVLVAQQRARLDAVGAASFTATLIRWAMSGPPAPYQKVTARQILTRDATEAARRSLSSSKNITDNSTATVDFSQGRYYVEAFDGETAIVSWTSTAHSTRNGVQLQDATIAGTVHLEAVNGGWRYRDLTGDRSIEDLERIGTAYSGGC